MQRLKNEKKMKNQIIIKMKTTKYFLIANVLIIQMSMSYKKRKIIFKNKLELKINFKTMKYIKINLLNSILIRKIKKIIINKIELFKIYIK